MGNRIAPVLDVARQLYIVESEKDRIISSYSRKIESELQIYNVQILVETGVGTLVCGAVSRHLHTMISACGISVIPFLSGDLNEIVNAWLNGNIDNRTFLMPGCRNHGWHGGRNPEISSNMEETVNQLMNGGSGQGGGRGMGQGGAGRCMAGGQVGGRQGGIRGQNKSGICVCPACGKTLPHERGIPCFEKKCPECGAAMTRG